MIIECLRVPKVGELLIMRRIDFGNVWVKARVTRIYADQRPVRVDGIVTEVPEYTTRAYGWTVGGVLSTSWFVNSPPWQTRRLIEVPDDSV